jgi:hypothetical protein
MVSAGKIDNALFHCVLIFSPTDHDNQRGIRLERPSSVVAQRLLNIVFGVKEEQAKLARKKDMTRKIVNRRFDPASVLILFVQETKSERVAHGFHNVWSFDESVVSRPSHFHCLCRSQLLNGVVH